MLEQDSSSPTTEERRREQNRLAQRRFRQRHNLRGKRRSAEAARASHETNSAEEPGTRSRVPSITDSATSSDFRPNKTTPDSDLTISQGTDSPDFDDFMMTFGDGLNAFTMPEAPFTLFTTLPPLHDTSTTAPAQHCGRDNPRPLMEQHLVKSKPARLDTPLHVAAGKGSAKIVQLLLQHGADCNAQGVEGKTPLAHAIIGNHESAADTLLLHGAQILVVDEQQRSALHLAVIHGRERVLRTLIRHCKGNSEALDVCDVEGNTPLHVAISMDLDSLVEILCEAGANVQLQPGKRSHRVV